jgi:hypothetical protein
VGITGASSSRAVRGDIARPALASMVATRMG